MDGDEPQGPPGAGGVVELGLPAAHADLDVWRSQQIRKEQPGMLFLTVQYEAYPSFDVSPNTSFPSETSEQSALTCLSNLDPDIGPVYEVGKSVIVTNGANPTASPEDVGNILSSPSPTLLPSLSSSSHIESANRQRPATGPILNPLSEAVSRRVIPLSLVSELRTDASLNSSTQLPCPIINGDTISPQHSISSDRRNIVPVAAGEDLVSHYQLNSPEQDPVSAACSLLPLHETDNSTSDILITSPNDETQLIDCTYNEQSLDKVELLIGNADGSGLTYTVNTSNITSMLTLRPLLGSDVSTDCNSKGSALVVEHGDYGELRVRRTSPLSDECFQDLVEVDTHLLEAIQSHVQLTSFDESQIKSETAMEIETFPIMSAESSQQILAQQTRERPDSPIQSHGIVTVRQQHLSSMPHPTSNAGILLRQPEPNLVAGIPQQHSSMYLKQQPEPHHHSQNQGRFTQQQTKSNRPVLAEKTFRMENNENSKLDHKKNCDCKASNSLWIDDSCACPNGDCVEHVVQSISDKPVLSRAWASLPAVFLAVNKFSDPHSGQTVTGVFARKMIPKHTQFGPLEGVLIKKPLSSHCESQEKQKYFENNVQYIIENESGVLLKMDLSDENLSNWMRFVRSAENSHEQNLALCQHGRSLYFRSIRDIPPREELLVWYSQGYAVRRGLPLEPKGIYHLWTCFKCNKTFNNSIDVQKHLNEHEAEQNENEDSTQLKLSKSANSIYRQGVRLVNFKRGKNKSEKGPGKMIHQCNTCKRIFSSNYTLRRHALMHTRERKLGCPKCDVKFSDYALKERHLKAVHNLDTMRYCTKKSALDEHTFENGLDLTISSSEHCTETAKISDEPTSYVQDPLTLTSRVPKKAKGTRSGENQWLQVLSCSQCSFLFPDSALLSLHTLSHGPSSSISDSFEEGKFLLDNGFVQCPGCCKTFLLMQNLVKHVIWHARLKKERKIDPARPHRCDQCYKGFASDDRLQHHMLVHGSDESKPIQCDICLKRFLTNSALACHIKTHAAQREMFDCPICKETFKCVGPLKEHVQTHANNGCFTCPHCEKIFPGYGPIRKHIRAFHNERTQKCNFCGHHFPTLDKLRMHMLRHSDHREFLCANCGKQFKRKDKLKEHMKRIHEREQSSKPSKSLKISKPPVRSLPEKKRKISLPRDKRTPDSDYERYMFKCHPCLQGFKRRGMLVNHLAKRHPNIAPEQVPELNLPIQKPTRDYSCQYCEKIYKSNSKRKAHILKYHPGGDLPVNRFKATGTAPAQPQNCPWCYKQYATKAKLLQHQRSKHSDKHCPEVRKKAGKKTKTIESTNQSDSNPVEDNIILAECTMTLLEGLQQLEMRGLDHLKEGGAKIDETPGDLLTQSISDLNQQNIYSNPYLNVGDELHMHQMLAESVPHIVVPKVVYSPYPPR